MDHFHDDDAYHHDKDDRASRPGRSSETSSQLTVAARSARTPSHVFKMGHHSDAQADDWRSIMMAELPEGCSFDTARNWIVDCETGRPVCGPFRVAARLKGVNGSNWHNLFEYIDHEGRMRESLFSAGLPIKDVAKGLVNDGFAIYGSTAAFERFIKFATPKQFGTVLLQPGHARLEDGTAVYAEKTGTILAARPAKTALVRAVGFGAERRQAGTLMSWQAEIASLAVGNPLLTFALSAAVAGPLLELAEAAPIGLNFYGSTSSGKSTALRLMASVYGDPVRLNTWNATQTAIELMAHQSNDGLLILDEFPSIPEQWHVAALMTLGNGIGRSRGGAKLALNSGKEAKIVTASSAEKSVRQFMRDVGITPPDGMSVRMIDIPVRRWTFGVFDELHGHPDGRAFSSAITAAAARHHGTAGCAFICWILRQEAHLRENLGALIAQFFAEMTRRLELDDVPGDVGRVLDAFALIGVAGELAIGAGIFPMLMGSAKIAAVDVARIWLAGRNGEVSERSRQIAERIYAARNSFVDLDARPQITATETGWKTTDFLHVLPTAFDRFAGPHPQSAARDLEADGLLRRGTEANCLMSRITVPRLRERKRVYSLHWAALLDALGLAED